MLLLLSTDQRTMEVVPSSANIPSSHTHRKMYRQFEPLESAPAADGAVHFGFAFSIFSGTIIAFRRLKGTVMPVPDPDK